MNKIICLFVIVVFIGVARTCTIYENEEKYDLTENIYSKYYARNLLGKVFFEGFCIIKIEYNGACNLREILNHCEQHPVNYVNSSFNGSMNIDLSGIDGKGKIKYRILNFYYSVKWKTNLHFFR